MIEPEDTEFSSTTSEPSGTGKKVHSFGERLFLAREQQGMTVQEVAKATHLPGEIIEAIERSDVDNLPQPTYVQGYIRAYAKFIDIPAETVLEEYNRIAPHVSETQLSPPPIQSHGPNSNTPLIKAVSLLLLIVVIMAGIYGVFSHYSEIVETMHKEPASVELDELDELDITLPEQMGVDVEDNEMASMDATVVDDSIVDTPSAEVLVENRQSENVLIQERVIGSDTERAALIEIQPIAKGDDIINLLAHNASWVEVIDGNGVKLHYNLVTAGKSIVLRGTAPFDIFLGNAPAVDIKMNDVEIDTTKYVRSNNIAHFKISMNDDEQIVFH